MKKALLAGTALLSVGLAASPAFAADGIKLGSGGFFKTAYLANRADGALAGFDDGAAAQALTYISPSFAGFQMTMSYTPNGDGLDARTGMPDDADGDARRTVSAYGAYAYEGGGWGLTAGAGASLEGRAAQTSGQDRDARESYQAGLNATVGNFAVGGMLAYRNDLAGQDATDRWMAGAGISYTLEAWTFGAQYAHLAGDGGNSAGADEFRQGRVTLTGNYALGPGINLDGELGYSWIDADPEAGAVDGTGVDDRDALEIGIGTNFTF